MKPLTVTGRIIQLSNATLKRNHHLFDLDPVLPPVGKSSPPDALVKSPRPQRRRRGRVEVIVTIITCRTRCLDDDNAASGGTKALRDIIAKSIGYDDGDSRIRFEYSQCQTVGQTGCLVKIATVAP